MTRKRRGVKKPAEPEMLTGIQCARLVRRWLKRDGYPAPVIELVMGELAWKDSPDPLGTRRALHLWYWREIDVPLRMAKVAELLRRAQERDW